MKQFEVVTYSEDSGIDEKRDFAKIRDAATNAVNYLEKRDGYYIGAIVYNIKTRRIVREYGDFPLDSVLDISSDCPPHKPYTVFLYDKAYNMAFEWKAYGTLQEALWNAKALHRGFCNQMAWGGTLVADMETGNIRQVYGEFPQKYRPKVLMKLDRYDEYGWTNQQGKCAERR